MSDESSLKFPSQHDAEQWFREFDKAICERCGRQETIKGFVQGLVGKEEMIWFCRECRARFEWRADNEMNRPDEENEGYEEGQEKELSNGK